MPKISLIGKDLAKEGMEFLFVGPLVHCSTCGIKNVCFNLDSGRSYRVVKVREKLNNCFVFNGDKVKTVEVEEVEDQLTMQFGRTVQEGSTVAMKSLKCDYLSCRYIEKCNLIHYKEGRKVTIKKVGDKVDCPKNLDIREITISTG